MLGTQRRLHIYGWVFEAGQVDAPDGEFTTVSAGRFHTCAIRENKTIECWGLKGGLAWNEEEGYHVKDDGRTDASEGSFTAVATGDSHACAIRSDNGAIECWGANGYREATPPTD